MGEAGFVRGHLASYARYLSLDVAEILAAYERESEGEPSPLEQLDAKARVAKKPQRPRWEVAAVLAAALLIAGSAVGLLHGPGAKQPDDTALPELPARIEQPQAASRSNAAPPPVQAAAGKAAPIEVKIIATGRCWIEAVSDGKVLASEVLETGAERTFTATTALKLSLGNAGAAMVSFNGTAVPLGASGVWSGTFGPRGLAA